MAIIIRKGRRYTPSASGNAADIFSELESRQLKRREIRLTGGVDGDMAHILGVKLNYLADVSKEPITIYMNTPGGAISDGLAMFDIIQDVRHRGVPVTIVAVGSCMSMGVVVMQAASKRYSLPNTSFLLHELSMVNAGSLGRLQDTQKEAERLQDKLDTLIGSRIGMKPAEFRKMVSRRDAYLTAQEAKELNLIDKVL